jgi:hypothetical protein
MWSSFNNCSCAAGQTTGYRERTRSCTNPPAIGGGNNCTTLADSRTVALLINGTQSERNSQDCACPVRKLPATIFFVVFQ